MRLRSFTCVAACVALIVLIVGAGVADANFKGQNGLIAFDSWTGTSQDIGVFDPNSSGYTLLTKTPDFSEHAPRWSPDGTKIAYMGHRQFGEDDDFLASDVWVMDANGQNRTQLTNTRRAEFVPAWTADGRIAFCGNDDPNDPNNFDIYLINADGSGLQRLTTSPDFDCWPSPSPAGNKLAFTSFRPAGPEIDVINLNGSGLRRVTSGFESDWSPSGNDLVFTRDDANGIGDIWMSHLDGTGLKQLTATPTTESFPSWSPDGSTVVFGRHVDPGVINIYSHDPVSGAEHLLLEDSPPTTYSVAYATWQPRPLGRP